MGISYLKYLHPSTRLFFAVMIVFFSMLVFTLLGFIIAIPLFNQDFSILIKGITAAGNIHLLKYLQVVQSIGVFIVPPVVLAWLFSDDICSYLKIKSAPGIVSILLVVLIMFSGIPFINYLVAINEKMSLPDFLGPVEGWMRKMEDAAGELTEDFLAADTFRQYMINMIVMALLPAIGEELLFRGILLRLFSEWTKKVYLGILISAFLFSAIHMQFYGFIPRFLLGILFGYLLVWSGSLWFPVIAHFFNNALAVTVYYLSSPQQNIYEKMDNIGKEGQMSVFLVTASILTMIICSYLFFKKNRFYYHFSESC